MVQTLGLPAAGGGVTTPKIMAGESASRLSHLFCRNEQGRRPVFGGAEKFQTDPHWKDLLLFYEPFHGDNRRQHRSSPPDRMDRAGSESY